MKKQNQRDGRNYKPLKIADSLRGINQKLLYKFGKIDYIIHAKWAEIVGVYFVQHSQPEKTTTSWNPSLLKENINNKQKILHVNVAPAAAIEFQHFQNKIIEKINSFFGYNAIHGIKIHQKLIKNNNFSPKKNLQKNSNIEQNKIEIKNTIEVINDKELEDSILNLGLSISKEENK